MGIFFFFQNSLVIFALTDEYICFNNWSESQNTSRELVQKQAKPPPWVSFFLLKDDLNW